MIRDSFGLASDGLDVYGQWLFQSDNGSSLTPTTRECSVDVSKIVNPMESIHAWSTNICLPTRPKTEVMRSVAVAATVRYRG